MFSDELIKKMKSDNGKIHDIIGLSYREIDYLIDECNDEELTKKMYPLYKRISDCDDINEASAIDSALRSIDVQHSFSHGIRFKVSEKVVGKSYDIDDLLKLDKEDAIFDFTTDCVVRLSKERYKLRIAGELKTIYVVCISYRNNKEASGCDSIQIEFCVDKFPRLLTTNDYCMEHCSLGSKKEFGLYENNNEMPFNCVLCGRRLRESGKCELSNLSKEKTGYSVDEVLSACLYAVSIYVNRRKHKTDKDITNGVQICRKIHESRETTRSDSRLVSIREYNSYERREKAEYKGGHHSSPVEHERSGYYRHYKSGKVIEVKPCIVNKGKVKAVYNIK